MTNPSPRAAPRLLAAQVFARDGLCCVRCGSEKDLQPDHVIPWSEGGPTTLENLQTLCGRCNTHKGPSGRRKLELSPEVERELRRAVKRCARADSALEAAIVRALEAGESQAAVARALGITRQAVADRVRRAGPALEA